MINLSDVKLLETERMTDTPDGGGRRTSREIADGVAGNIFPKVSRVDSVYGRVNMRKVVGTVKTANQDTFAGAHIIITDAPDNNKIHCTAFSTGSEFDTRTDARDRVEAYVTAGPESRMVLLGRQLKGQQSVVAYQRLDDPLPEIGVVVCLSTETAGVVSAQQYFRIQSVDSEVRTGSDTLGDFQRRVVTLGTGVALRYDFTGPGSMDRMTNVTRPSLIRMTTVVDAARYFGIQPLSQAAHTNDLTIKVDSPYSQIVPTTKRETPLSNISATSVATYIPSALAELYEIPNVAAMSGTVIHTSRQIMPGSLKVYAYSTYGGDVLQGTDTGLGTFVGTGLTGTIDYELGTITFPTVTFPHYGQAVSFRYIPATLTSQIAHTHELPITLGTRGTSFAIPLNPIPTPGALRVDFRALGKWYSLNDLGTGELRGADNAYGVGSIDYGTGGLILTLGALPDVGSSVIISWGSAAHYKVRSGVNAVVGTTITQTIQLTNAPIVSDSVSLTFKVGGVTKNATDNGVGIITGTGVSGLVDYTTGVIDLVFTTLPDATTGVVVSYSKEEPVTPGDQRLVTLSQGASSVINLGVGVEPGSFYSSVPYDLGNSGGWGTIRGIVIDNGVGGLILQSSTALPHSGNGGTDVPSGSPCGSINYTTGQVLYNVAIPFNRTSYASAGATAGSWALLPSSGSILEGGAASYSFKTSGVSVSPIPKTDNIQFSAHPLRIDLTKGIAETLVPNSLKLSLAGKTYFDKAGSLYTDYDAATGAASLAGTMDYLNGYAYLSLWIDGAAFSPVVSSCLTTYGDYSTYQSYFRTSGAPLRQGSFYIQATTTEGALLTATGAEGGSISGTLVSGFIDHDIGLVRVIFGGIVTAAGHESESWYDAANVIGGMIFKPTPVFPNTIKYSTVVQSNLPLDADVLGLDPVRLPSDGRVPIYRPADMVVVHNTQSVTLPNPAVAAAVYPSGRTDLSELWLEDSAKVRVPTSQYAADLTTGSVTMSAGLDLGALTQPLKLFHRIEDMALISDVQINGTLQLIAPLTRDYPALTSFVSSAILFGDLRSRVEHVFDLQSFTVWSDTAGSGSNSQYNDIDFPIEVLNNGAVTERWRINFTSTTAYQVIGENLGVIGTGTTTADCTMANQLTGNPYFVIRAGGWGTGWAAGNQLRFNTVGCSAPIWIIRTVLPGATLEGDSFSMQTRGDVDAV